MTMRDAHFFRFTPSVWIVPFLLTLSVWTVFYFDTVFKLHLNNHGIYPRTISGLQGVVFSPFLHGNLDHIVNNTLPLFILTMALVYFYREVSLKVLLYGILISGALTWLIGRPNIHIGASSLIYVLVSFIFFKGLMTKYYRLMALSFAVVLLYGGMIWYVFPDVDHKISWEGHLAGFITGYIFAWRFKTPDYVEELRYEWEKPEFDPMQDPFMKRFDADGNFVNPPKPEEIEVIYEEVLEQPVRYIYTYKEGESK